MSDWPHLPRAPVTEALVDLRVEFPGEVSLDQLDALHEKWREEYPKKSKRVEYQGSFRFAGRQGLKTDTATTQRGFDFRNPDETQVVQARLDGFTFSRLRPYTDWADFTAKSRALWDVYQNQTRPSRVTRIALRYINRIEIPLPMNDFKDWILTLPEIAPDLPQGLAGYFMRLVLPFEKQKLNAIVTQAIEPGDHVERLPIIFDIDVFQKGSFSSDGEDIWPRLGELRDIKNRVFFRSLTDRAKELFK